MEIKQIITQAEEAIVDKIRTIQPNRALWQPIDVETEQNIEFERVNNKEQCLCGKRLKYAYPYLYEDKIIYVGETCSREHFNKYREDGRANVKLTYMEKRLCVSCGRHIPAGPHSIPDHHYSCYEKTADERLQSLFQSMNSDNPLKKHIEIILKERADKGFKQYEANNRIKNEEPTQIMSSKNNDKGNIITNADKIFRLQIQYDELITAIKEYEKKGKEEEAAREMERREQERIRREIDIQTKKKERESRLDAIYNEHKINIEERDYMLIGEFKYYDKDKKRYIFYVYNGAHTASTDTARKISNYIKRKSTQYFSPVWFDNAFNCYRVVVEGDREALEQDKYYIFTFSIRQRTRIHGMKFIYTKKEAPAFKIDEL